MTTAVSHAKKRHAAFLVWRDLTHPEGGGCELFVERVARELHAAGWAVTIVCAAHDGAARDEVVDGVRIRRRGGRLGVYLRGLLYLLSRDGRRNDVVIDVQNGLPFFSPLVRRRPIVNLLHHVHREQWQLIYPGVVGRVGWWLESVAAPRVYRRHRYITVSEASRQDLVGLGIDGARIDVVHNGVDLPDRQPPLATHRPPTLCVLGRLVPHKQVEHALDVLARLRPSYPDLRADVIGDGYWREPLEEAARELGVGDRVTFHGHVSDAERDALLDRAALLLAPSVKEGWGIGIMEAAAHGVPAIAYSSAGGVRESVVDAVTGWLVDDLEELTKRTDELLSDSQLRLDLGTAARSRAAHFSWTASGARFAELLARRLDAPAD